MPNRKITVTLTGPVKLDGEDRKAGDQVEVTMSVALQLVELGALAGLPEVDLGDAQAGEDPALHEKARAMAETLVGQKVAEAMAETAAQLDNERRRADELALQLSETQAERDSLMAQLAVALAERDDLAVAATTAEPETADPAGGQVTDAAQKKRGK